MPRKILKILFKIQIIFFAAVTASLAEKADFVIIENPEALQVYNKYQQAANKTELQPRTAFRILNENLLLSDQITPAMKVQSTNEEYFFVLDEDGQLLNADLAGSIKSYKNCQVINDTIFIKKNKAELIYQRYFNQPDNQRFYLEEGECLVRMFKYRSSYYLYSIDRREMSGWARLSGSKNWQVVEQEITETPGFSTDLTNRILQYISDLNKKYTKYFEIFNEFYRQNRNIPKWQTTISENEIVCTLTGTDMSKLEKSSEQVVRELDNMILGTGYYLQRIDNSIVISTTRRDMQ